VQDEIDGVTCSRYQHWYGKMPAFVNNLRIWGETGAVTLRSKMTPKIENRGVSVKNKIQESVTLSVTEAKLVVVTSAIKKCFM
jgi:hypothetical protein